jgi:copper resistance protein C
MVRPRATDGGRASGRRFQGRVLALPLIALAVSAGPGAGWRPAAAGHGGVVELNRAAAGPYTLSIWTQPSPPVAGDWRVDIAVIGETGAPVADAVVRVRAEPLPPVTAEPVEVEARRDADPLGIRYRASLGLSASGPWRVSVSVSGTRGPGALTFPVDVEPEGHGWWLAVGLAVAGLVIWGAVTAWRRRLAAAALGVLLLTTPAWPHASLVKSSPGRRATLTTAPDRVQLWFNEAIEPRFSNVTVWDAAGQRVDLGDARVEPEDPKRLTVGVKPLGRGAYRVRFRVLSVDGHVVESEFPFTLRP